MTQDSRVLILGAGPAGLATAMELWKAGVPSTVVERNATVGGLARTLVFREGDDVFRTDIGPHRFFSKNPYLYDFIRDLIGDDWILVDRLTHFFIGGKLYRYPIEWKNALRNLGFAGAAAILRDYAHERLKDIWDREDPRTFEEFAIRTFGRALAELNMLNYTQKIWGLPTGALSVDWAHQRIKGLNFLTAVKNAVRPRSGKEPKTLVDHFYYPAHGTGLTYEAIARRIRGETKFFQTSEPTKVRHEGNRVTSVDILTPSGPHTQTPATVVSSLPITDFLALLDPPPPPAIREHAEALRYRSQVYLFLTVNQRRVFPDQWIYFPELEIPFGRVSEMKNFSPQMAPPHATSLFVEFFCWEGDAIWSASKEALLQRSLPFFERFGWLRRSDIRHVYLHRQSKVYPVYDLRYLEHLALLKAYLDHFENLHSIGRPGRFKYNNQDHSLEMGILTARSILERTRYPLDEIAGEKAYFETGRLPQPKATQRVDAGTS